jgi:hypothetical protein
MIQPTLCPDNPIIRPICALLINLNSSLIAKISLYNFVLDNLGLCSIACSFISIYTSSKPLILKRLETTSTNYLEPLKVINYLEPLTVINYLGPLKVINYLEPLTVISYLEPLIIEKRQERA